MGKIDIEKNIPISTYKSTHIKYPFNSMDVGDSFLAPFEGIKFLRSSIILCKKYYNSRNKKSIKICTKKTDKGIRVWRTE
jgi:hypothetical protein